MCKLFFFFSQQAIGELMLETRENLPFSKKASGIIVIVAKLLSSGPSCHFQVCGLDVKSIGCAQTGAR